MATVFENVQLSSLSENGESKSQYDSPVRIELLSKEFSAQLNILNGTQTIDNINVNKEIEFAKVGHKSAVVSTDKDSVMLRFPSSKDLKNFETHLKDAAARRKDSVFSQRTDEASAEQYFQFYGYLSQQQNMMQDYIRTSTYQRAMLDNSSDFMDKVVLDVGAGSGILSFFAIQAGARKVYAVEASSMALHCSALIKNNRLEDRITVITGRVEEIEIPEPVDIIISEPMGYMLFNERMLETYLHAKKWLKPGGKMFPTQGDLHIAPFTDEALYMEQYSKANFWYQPAFHGVDLSSLREAAVKEYFRQPIVDTFDIRICLARSVKHTVDFQTADETDLHDIKIPVSFIMLQAGNIHGLAFWFDVAFLGSQNTVWLSTSPTQPLTHWYQVRCLLEHPIFVKQGQTLQGTVHLRCNKRQSYDVDIELYIPGTNTKSANTLDLKNPFFRYTGQQPQPPPGTDHTSPSDNYWDTTDQAQANVFSMGSLLNGGGMGDGQVQSGVVHNNLVQLANAAPINPGSIPAATIVNANSAAQLAMQTRTSVGAGVSPVAFGAAQQSSGANPQAYPVSNQFMIGDYVLPGNMMSSSQGLNLNNYKSNSRGGK